MLRPGIEELHCQCKCFWRIPRMHSCRFSLVLNQVLFMLPVYTLMHAHLFLRRPQELNRRTRARVLDTLGPAVQGVAVHSQQRFCLLSLAKLR